MANKIPLGSLLKVLGLFFILTMTGCNFPGLAPTPSTTEVDHSPTEAPM